MATVVVVVVAKVHSRGQHACERGFEVVGCLKLTFVCRKIYACEQKYILLYLLVKTTIT